MKIIRTEIECTAEELRQSNDLSSAFVNLMRNFFNGSIPEEKEDPGDEE